MSAAARAVSVLAHRVQRWPLATATRRGKALGRLAYRVDRRHRQVALRNLALAFPESDADWRAATARASFEQAGRTMTEMLWSPRLREEPIGCLIEMTGLDRLRRAVDAGRGVILAGSHFGNWEVFGVELAAAGIPLTSIARPLDDPDLDRLLNDLRTATGAEILPKSSALRGAIRALRGGRVVTVLADQNTLRHEAVFVPYFGKLAATTPVLAHLHLRTGAPIVPAFAVPFGDRYELVVEEPVRISTDDRHTAIRELTAAYTARVEHHARSCPEAWLWMHDRWRERPAEEIAGELGADGVRTGETHDTSTTGG